MDVGVGAWVQPADEIRDGRGAEVPESLVAAANRGDRQAIDALVAAHRPLVIRIAWRMLGHREDVQDAAQEVLLRLVRSLHRLDSERDPAPWVCRVTINVCRTALRRRRWRTEPVDAITGDEAATALAVDPTQERRISAVDAARTLHTVLARLSARERAAVVLRDLEGMSTRDTARALGCGEGTVRSHLCRGRLRLRELLLGQRKDQP